MGRLLQARIDSAALLHNVKRIKQLAPNRSIIAMVKANAYGHGLVAIAQTLTAEQIDPKYSAATNDFALGVACIEEALQLRAAGVTGRIILCEGFFSADELPEIVNNKLEIVVHNDFQVEILEAAQMPLQIWVKIDTGMNRLGFRPDAIVKMFSRLIANENLTIAGIMTHFSNADALQDHKTSKQIALFNATLSKLMLSVGNITSAGNKIPQARYNISMANSAAILAWPGAHGDWIRPGIMLYGVSPFADRTGADFGLQQVMTLETNIIAIKIAARGETVGYGSRFICQEDMRIGVIAVGYGDGYTAKIPDGTPVLINGKRTTVVGKVSMDMAVVDLRNNADAKIGDKVILWGTGLPVEEIANYTGIMAYELLTSLGTRVVRQYGART